MSELGHSVGPTVGPSPLAPTLQPPSAADAPHPRQPGHCLNCGTGLVGAYCHACGQEAHLHRSIGALAHDLLHGALHFEGKLWHTLPLLALRPGALTRRYIAGERARFVSPMALFLFSVFLMFAAFQALGITAPAEVNSATELASGLETARATAEDELADARADLADLPAGDPRRQAGQQRVAQAQADLRGLEQIANLADRTQASGDTGIALIDDHLLKKWRENPTLMLYKLQANSYKFSWLLIPLSTPFVWLLFAWKRRFNFYDHAIFVTYSLSFMTLLFVAVSVLVAAGLNRDLLSLVFVLIPPLHMYKQLRGAYSLRRRSAIWRLLVLCAMIVVILGLFLQVLLVLGAF
jgi:hypothetical protein